MRVLITGINGFVGIYLRELLMSTGDEIFGIDINSDNPQTYGLDLLNYQEVEKTVQKIQPDFVYHLAAISRVDINEPDLMYTTNIGSTMNLFKACSNLIKKPRIIFISSSQVYGIVEKNDLPVNEFKSILPVNHYGASKAACENIVHAFGKQCGIEYMIARPFNHTGKGQTTSFVIPKIVQYFNENASEIELGDITPERDFLDVRDVVSAYNMMRDYFVNGEIMNICSGTGVSVSGIIELIKNITGKDIRIITNKELFRSSEIKKVIGDNTKIKQKLGWAPQFSIEDTIRSMVE